MVALHDELEQSGVVQALPAVDRTGTSQVLVIVDPFRNRLVFHQGELVGDAPVAGPIVNTVGVHAAPTAAFAVFTGRIGGWCRARATRPDRCATSGSNRKSAAG